MRPFLAIAVWIVMVGGLIFYMHARDTKKPAATYQSSESRDIFALRLTTTFDVEPDPFALRTDDDEKPVALLVKVNGKEVLRRSERLERGAPILIEPIPGLFVGNNEIFIEANPPLEKGSRSEAVRVQVLRDGHSIEDRSFWSEEASRIAVAFPVKIEPAKQTEDGHGRH